MKIKNLFPFLLILIFACKESSKEYFDAENYRAELRGNAVEFMKELKSVLQKNMKDGGPLQAATVCSDTAQVLSKQYSISKNLDIKRVSFKNRNPQNKPDEFETESLIKFEQYAAEGTLSTETELIEKVSEDGVELIRYMKPITIDTPCLLCHGDQSQMLTEVTELIKTNYPNDKAVNYKIGDLRGAISIRKKL